MRRRIMVVVGGGFLLTASASQANIETAYPGTACERYNGNTDGTMDQRGGGQVLNSHATTDLILLCPIIRQNTARKGIERVVWQVVDDHTTKDVSCRAWVFTPVNNGADDYDLKTTKTSPSGADPDHVTLTWNDEDGMTTADTDETFNYGMYCTIPDVDSVNSSSLATYLVQEE